MKFLPIFLTTFFFPLLAFAQNTDQPEESGSKQGRKGYWEAVLKGGSYLVRVRNITAISRHSYLLDGTLIVDEVTIDTNGQSLARFYYIEPLTLPGEAGEAITNISERGKELVDGAAGRGDVEIQNMVMKTYPETTHAGTVEYRVLSKASLDAIFISAKNAWTKNRDRIFTDK